MPKFHVLIPANQANYKVCRTIASAVVNDYPPPIIINWEQKENDPSMNGYDMTTGKTWGILEFMKSMDASSIDDIILMVDAYDSVFQLPFAIAVSRYIGLRAEAMARITQQHGKAQVDEHDLSHTIIMGAEKYCWPHSHKHPACFAVPTSPLPATAYGALTDKKMETNRPRWLNSGTIMGPVSDMVKLYTWSHQMWKSYDTGGGDQDYFSNIWGRQELGRQRLRNSTEWIFGFGEDFKEDELIWPHMETRHTDYHLGVDMTSGLFQALNGALTDMSSVVHGNVSDVDFHDAKHGTDKIYLDPFQFPVDMQGLAVPVGMPPGTRWQDVRLFSNFHARTIPAIMHYNGDKSKMDEWWTKQWWMSHGREMMNLRAARNADWVYTDKIVNGTYVKYKYDELCGEYADRVFVKPAPEYS